MVVVPGAAAFVSRAVAPALVPGCFTLERALVLRVVERLAGEHGIAIRHRHDKWELRK